MCKNRRIMHELTRVRLPRGRVVTTVDTAHGRCGKQQCAQSDWGISPIPVPPVPLDTLNHRPSLGLVLIKSDEECDHRGMI
jgi:hypothetical protein